MLPEVAAAESRTYNRGDIVFTEADEATELFVVESGRMTKDLAILIRADHPYLTTEEFLAAIDTELKARMA